MSCHGPQATANSQTHACSHFTTTRWHGVLHTKRSDFGGQRSFAFATFRLVLFTTFFTAPMGRCKIQRGAFTFGVSHWYTPQDVPTPPHRRRGGRAQLTRAGRQLSLCRQKAFPPHRRRRCAAPAGLCCSRDPDGCVDVGIDVFPATHSWAQEGHLTKCSMHAHDDLALHRQLTFLRGRA